MHMIIAAAPSPDPRADTRPAAPAPWRARFELRDRRARRIASMLALVLGSFGVLAGLGTGLGSVLVIALLLVVGPIGRLQLASAFELERRRATLWVERDGVALLEGKSRVWFPRDHLRVRELRRVGVGRLVELSSGPTSRALAEELFALSSEFEAFVGAVQRLAGGDRAPTPSTDPRHRHEDRLDRELAE
jgi:hypothetical protein